MLGSKNKAFERIFIQGLKRVFPQLIRKCPYSGVFTVNGIVGKQYFQANRAGTYKITAKLTDDISKNFIFGSVILEIVD